MWLISKYTDEDALASGVVALRKAGFDSGAIEVFSSRPLELPAAFVHPPSRASLIAVLGAIVNGGLATAFIYYVQHDYPLVTGGMPIFSWWATGIITYEMTMAGAMAGVVLAFLWESGLLRRRGPAPPVDHAASFIRVHCGPEAAPAALDCLEGTGAVEVAKLEDRP
ncbi:MAG: DUF3341 domain-containing protein [Bryobacteraceae bacterium]|nr:DUF3341 domain-containing protein [Bryobacteraceae bacterium]